MRNLRISSHGRGLISLTLTIEIEEDGEESWKGVWYAAAKLFRTSTIALGRTKLPIEVLDIFHSVDSCSLACGEIAKVLKRVDLANTLRRTKSVSLSLSHQQTHKQVNIPMYPFHVGRANAHAITYFLNLCPKLATLRLHWYNLDLVNLAQAEKEEQPFFGRITKYMPFQLIATLYTARHLHLRGQIALFNPSRTPAEPLHGTYTSGSGHVPCYLRIHIVEHEEAAVFAH